MRWTETKTAVLVKSSAELANALQYARADFVARIYDRNKDEFTPCMTETVNLTFNGINNSLCEKTGRIFSLCGAHLIAMFAHTPIEKEFRKWGLDILDKEVGVPQYQPESPEVFNGNDLNNLARFVLEMSHGFHVDHSWRHGIWFALQ